MQSESVEPDWQIDAIGSDKSDFDRTERRNLISERHFTFTISMTTSARPGIVVAAASARHAGVGPRVMVLTEDFVSQGDIGLPPRSVLHEAKQKPREN
jgi:hypothetical protein